MKTSQEQLHPSHIHLSHTQTTLTTRILLLTPTRWFTIIIITITTITTNIPVHHLIIAPILTHKVNDKDDERRLTIVTHRPQHRGIQSAVTTHLSIVANALVNVLHHHDEERQLAGLCRASRVIVSTHHPLRRLSPQLVISATPGNDTSLQLALQIDALTGVAHQHRRKSPL